MIREATLADADAILQIYNHYIANSIATFEEQLITPADMAARMEAGLDIGLPWFVCVDENSVMGYAYAGRFHQRSAYRATLEVTVYLSPSGCRRGTGTRLYQRLFERLQELDVHSVIALIALPNDASIALHERFGLSKVGHLSQAGHKFGQWIDVGYWQSVPGTPLAPSRP